MKEKIILPFFFYKKRERKNKEIIWLTEIEDSIILPFLFYIEKEWEKETIWLIEIKNWIILPFLFYRERRERDNLFDIDKRPNHSSISFLQK
jgi:hypothetical protein